ncbi:hypothetical protein [Fimbriiglobus ruber]|uniref:Uncharacterized protein n=1 Tax=Fimbriiglobus ruber TaxID=1908690 RepID=A0A225DAX2_9BACT|nr:hypothetical protein [Fimbriiglobus ruber]OWK35688.1 hypothetical protein FRUB_08251 [Fimbriiglobus ruber]OWK38384.1 hypothetical protein FRUB_07504 [Fimbriiglobus ruber]
MSLRRAPPPVPSAGADRPSPDARAVQALLDLLARLITDRARRKDSRDVPPVPPSQSNARNRDG